MHQLKGSPVHLVKLSRLLLSVISFLIIFQGLTLVADERPNYAVTIPAGTIKPFVNGDRIAFLGDSITCGGTYHKFIFTYWVTRHPSVKISYFNKGIFSDFADGGIRRLDFDVLKEKPNKIAIDYGMNDSGASFRRDLYGMKDPDQTIVNKRKETIASFRKNIEQLLATLKEKQITPILVGATIYDETMVKEEGKNQLGGNFGIQACIRELQDLSAKNGYEFVDLNAPMLVANAAVQKADPKGSIAGSDRVHPGVQGHWLMAYTFLKAQSVTPYVAKVSINAAIKKIASTENCEISNLSCSENSVSFGYFPKSLPFPFNKEYQAASGIVPITEELNQELVQLSGLKEGKYSLMIDDSNLGNYSSEELQQGVNLAVNLENPGQKQALKLDAIIQEQAALQGKIRMLRQQDVRLSQRFLNGEREKIIAEFKEKLEEAKKATNKSYEIGQLTTYLTDIQQEETMESRILEIQEQVYKDNQPSKRTIKIEKFPQ